VTEVGSSGLLISRENELGLVGKPSPPAARAPQQASLPTEVREPRITSSAWSADSPQAEDQVCIEMIAQARQVWLRPFTRPATSISPNERISRRGEYHSPLMAAARITLPHFSVNSTMNLLNSAGELANGSAPKSPSRALNVGISKGGIHLLVEDRDDLRRRARGSCNAIPTARLVTRHEIPDRITVTKAVIRCATPSLWKGSWARCSSRRAFAT
jgi:hypothetical protein